MHSATGRRISSLAMLLSLTLATPGGAQEQGPTFRARTNVVTVPVLVR
jgi:hypothetical protein